MSVHYKFKSTLDYDTVSFDGLHISVADLKKAIFHQKRIGKNTDFDLQITNAQTKEDYTDDNALIAKNTSLIIARVPLTVQQKRSWDRNEPQSFANSKDESTGGHPVDLTRLDGSEDDKIRAMMTQSTQDYDPSNYMKIRGANQTGDVPPNYRCYKCHQPGHWIKNCPLGSNQEPIEIKKSTGIPRSFMVPVESPLVPGAMMTPTGHYAVPAIDHQAYKEGKKERPPFSHDPEPAPEKPEIPEDLLCNICKDLLTDAVMIPCCGNSFCDECIRSFLLESEEHECPDCSEKDVSPETLIPNRFLRNAVMNFKNETGYAKRQTYRPALQKLKPIVEKEKEVEPILPSEPIQEPKEIIPTPELEPEPEPVPEPEPLPIVTSVPAVLDEPTVEPEPITKPVVKISTEEEREVIIPPPPGTEPLLPIPSIKNSPEKENEPSESQTRKNDREDDYGDYRRIRDRRRSFSKEGQRDRSGDGGRRMESFRPMNRKRSLSPRQPQRGDYPVHGTGLPHMINQSKGYQNMPPGNPQRYPPSMHYDSDIHRSAEDRPGTPTVDEPHLHSQPHGNQAPLLPYPPGEDRLPPPPTPNYNQPPPTMAPLNPPLLPDPYMTHSHRMPMYPHQQGPHYGPPRYDRPPYQQSGYRPSQPPRSYNGPPRPMRGMHHLGYRGIQPPPPGLGRSVHNGNPPGVIDDPLEAFERMLREKDERDRRLGKHRRRSRTRSRSRSYTRSRSRSFGRRSPPPRITRSRSPPPKRRTSRSPMPLRRSRTPKRRSRSGSFSMSRSRSYSRSQSPRGSMSRDRDRDRERDRERDRDRDLPARYRSPVRSPPRFQRERERERERERDRPKSREPREGYNSYYNDSSSKEFGFRDRERERDGSNRDRPGSRYQSRNQSLQHNIPSLMSHPPPPLMSLGAAPLPSERKDYYDSYNRYSGSSAPQQRFNSPSRDSHHKRFDDVAPPGTEGYYDLPPPGVDHPERSTRDDRDRPRLPKDPEERDHKEADDDRPPREERVRERDTRERDDRDRRDRDRDRERDDRPIPKEKDDRDRREVKDKEHDRHIRRDDDRQMDRREYEKEKEKDRYRDDRERDRHRTDDKIRGRERVDRKDREFEEKERERHDRHSADRKKTKKSSSPHPTKTRAEIPRDVSPEKKKEKKIRDKKKKKDTAEEKLEKKKKKKKEKKSLKEAIAKIESAKLSSQFIEKQVSPVDEKMTETAPSLDIKSEEQIHARIALVNRDEQMEENDSATIDDEKGFSDKTMIKRMMLMNPEPPEKSEVNDDSVNSDAEFGLNPPNPNFKPIPEAKSEAKPIDSLYGGLDDTEINAVITEKYSLLPDSKIDLDKSINETSEDSMVEESTNLTEMAHTTPPRTSNTTDKSPKDEFLAPLPELSKWERDERDERDEPEDDDDTTTITDKLDISTSPPRSDTPPDELKSTKVVTSEVLKRAENAIFQKAINAIRPIEIKKISESRKILYQNPEPKTMVESNPEPNRTSERKSVNVTINVGRNERNVEITEPAKKSKLDRSKFKGANESPHSPTRLSAKERLGEKVDDEKDEKNTPYFEREKEFNKSDSNTRVRSRSPKASRKISPNTEVRRVESHSSSISMNPERKVFLEDKKREKIDRPRDHRSHQISERYESRDVSLKHERIDSRDDVRGGRNDYRSERLEKERRVRTPTQLKHNLPKRRLVEDEFDKKKEKRSREDKKRKKEHRSTSRSKSKDCKRKKEKKHKDKKQKHKDQLSAREKAQDVEKKTSDEQQIPSSQQPEDGAVKKLRKNPRLSSDRKRSALDEASFEPDYSATDSDTEADEKPVAVDASDTAVQAKKPKLDDSQVEPEKETEVKVIKKRVRSMSSDDDSSSTSTSSSESDDSAFRKRKKKHKKHKKRKSTRKESSSDSDSYSDSSDSSSDEEKHKKKSKKSKSKSKQSKKKKKSKHK